MSLSPSSRRRFVETAARSFLGVTALSGLPVGLRAAGKGASTLRQEATAKRVIYLYMNGGMSHLDTLDPKKDSKIMGPTKRLRTPVDGVFFGDSLPRLARQADKLSLIRSMTSTQGAHKQGQYFAHTSYELRTSIRHPSMGAWREKLTGKTNPNLPGSVLIGGDSNHPGSGFFESRLSPLRIGDPSEGLKNSSRHRSFSEESFDFHRNLSDQLDAAFVERYDQKNVRAYSDMYTDAVRLMRSSDLAAFDIADEPERLRERYGDDYFGQGCLLARRLIENGVDFVEVSFNGWDTHNANFVRVPEQGEILDKALSALLSDLERRGLLDDTLVVLATEFGRTPEINVNEGRDHHPQAFTCALAGGGISGGMVIGGTDERGAKIIGDGVELPDLNATVAYALGLPLDQVVYSPSMRPFTIADRGQPVTALFG
ncbi:MAG: DUF1501 domain-containing protein [Verrucomicrobiota bacterium]